jgi:5-methylcytosine-specific restriction endonuclease McrA
MELGEELVRVRSLSDEALLFGLAHSLRASRRAAADIVVHLGEVEERRLHLLGGYSSMFDYCVTRLGMSEDEAYRRLEVARLVRRYPVLLEKLTAGQITLSVAALLKARLTDANHEALLTAVSGKTVAQAREVLAAWFPQPDATPLLRKLPTRPVHPAVGEGPRSAACDAHAAEIEQPLAAARAREPVPSVADPASVPVAQPTEPFPSPQHTSPRLASSVPGSGSTSRCVEPLSLDRYKLQLTVTAGFKRKLDLARDLLRHAVPSGDLATLLERALDLLLEQTTQRRFAKRKPPSSTSEPTLGNSPISAAPVVGSAASAAPMQASTAAESLAPAATAPSIASRHIPSKTRRAVLERDGLRCTWQGPDGTRCNSQAWLEYDHIIPRGKGGTHDPVNGRMLCRPHNRLSAEQAYGRDTITRVIISRRRRFHPPANGAADPSTQ